MFGLQQRLDAIPLFLRGEGVLLATATGAVGGERAMHGKHGGGVVHVGGCAVRCGHTSLYARPMVDAMGLECYSRCSTIRVVVKTLGVWSSVLSAGEVLALGQDRPGDFSTD
jgi:hypothetical protein